MFPPSPSVLFLFDFASPLHLLSLLSKMYLSSTSSTLWSRQLYCSFLCLSFPLHFALKQLSFISFVSSSWKLTERMTFVLFLTSLSFLISWKSGFYSIVKLLSPMAYFFLLIIKDFYSPYMFDYVWPYEITSTP